jgi:L-threonylcarbamoyladenylate synthase
MSTASIGTDIAYAAELIRDGELVGMPTETVYGLAANAFDEDAVLTVFEVKKRPSFDPLIVHVAKAASLREVADLKALTPEVRRQVKQLTARFWPGPLTLVLPKVSALPDLVTSGLDTVAVRVPGHEMARALIVVAGVPLAAPSANPFGYVSPTTAQHVVDQLGDVVPYVLEGGACDVGVESTIVAAPRAGVSDAWTLLRDGGLPREALQDALGAPLVDATAADAAPAAPGQLESHYAPRTPLRVGPLAALLAEAQASPASRVHCVAFREAPAGVPSEVLSPSGDLREAARKLFAALRRADQAGADVLLAEPVPDEGLGRAINDRLRRASAPAAPT